MTDRCSGDEEKKDGVTPLHAQLDSISQAGAREAGGESQRRGVSPRTRHSQSPLSLPEPGQTLSAAAARHHES